MQCLWVWLSLLHCYKIGCPCQTNFWPQLSQQMCQTKTIPVACYPWYQAMDFRIQVFHKIWYLNVILYLWTQLRIPRAVCNYHTFWQIQILTHGPKICHWFCTTKYGTGPTWSWQCWSIHWWYYNLWYNLGGTSNSAGQSLILPCSKWFHP